MVDLMRFSAVTVATAVDASVVETGVNRSLQAVVPSIATYEGDGFLVHRPFPTRALVQVDPFLLLDEMGLMELASGEAKGASDHPHRGFEIVTYMLAGEMEHADSHGHRGSMAAGDAQYMLAGDGVVHAEMPSTRMTRDGGTMHGVQLWINLPAAEKRLAPFYRDLRATGVPAIALPNDAGIARVLVGSAFGATSPLQTQHPIDYVHLTLAPHARVSLPTTASATAIAYLVRGTIVVATRTIARGELAIFRAGETAVEIVAGESGAELVALVSEPIGEPIARYGPFVMTTEREIEETLDAYRSGRFGTIAAAVAAT